MKRITIFACLLCLYVLPGCKKEAADQNADDAANQAAKNAAQTAIHIEQNATSTWIEFEKDGTKVMRCLDIRGCEFNGRKYNAGTETVSWSAYCGENDAFPFVANYVCDPRVSSLRCAAENECPCGNRTVSRGAICSKFNAELKTDNAIPDDITDTDTLKRNDDNTFTATSSFDARTTSDEMTNSCKARKNALTKIYGTQFECFDVVETTHSRVKSDGTFDTNEHYEPVFYCNNKKGCKTPDGRIFNYKMHDLLEGRGNAISNEVCPYYVQGRADSTYETRCPTGDCVWPDGYAMKTVQNDVYIFSNDNEGSQKDKLSGYKAAKALKGYADKYNKAAMPVTASFADTKTCEGGRLFCHGINNAPVPIPAMREGFECRILKDNIGEWLCTAKNGCPCGDTVTPMGGYCYENTSMCGGIVLYEDNNYKCMPSKTDSMAECIGESCKCGTQSCLAGQACAFGNCYCGEDIGEFPPESGWKCTNYNNSATDRKMLCTNEEGCTVNGRVCPPNSSYRNNQCVCGEDAYPGPAFQCDFERQKWLCNEESGCTKFGTNYNKGDAYVAPSCLDGMPMTDNGCMCGDVVTAPGAVCAKSNEFGYVSVCLEPDGCNAKTSRCNYGEYIKDGVCLTPQSTDGPAAVTYWVEKTYQRALAAKRCDTGLCDCNGTQCKTGSYCMEGRCTDGIIAIDRYDQTFRYEFSSDFGIDLQNDPVKAKSIIERMLFGDWKSCHTINQVMRGDATWHISQPGDDIGDYTCKFTVQKGTNSPSEGGMQTAKGYVVPAGLSCDKGADCMCGTSICDGSACICHTVQGKLACGCADGNAIHMDSPGILNCSDTLVSMQQKSQYKCWNGIGFVCHKAEGCDCGSAKCEAGAVCLKPDACTPVVMKIKAP